MLQAPGDSGPEPTPADNPGPMAGEQEDAAYIGFDFSTQQVGNIKIYF